MTASSKDLHPRSGARFAFERDDDGYRVVAYLPEGARCEGRLAWEEGAGARIEPPLTPAWAHAEALKLARVLHRDPKPRLLRWRPEP
jgi:hypothetical protein